MAKGAYFTTVNYVI